MGLLEVVCDMRGWLSLCPLVGWVFITGCGGNAVRQGDDGSGGGGGSSNTSGGPGNTASSTSAGGSTGTSSATATTTGLSCVGVSCASPDCPDGSLVVREGECCPVCDCSSVQCDPVKCSAGLTPVREPGRCCETCGETRCPGVECLGAEECGAGYEYGTIPGACCGGCLPIPGEMECLEQVCPEPNCPAGYILGDSLDSCCYDCLPDPLYCSDVGDCVVALHALGCGGCPTLVSRRLLEDDPCWYEPDGTGATPSGCRQETCLFLSAPCPTPAIPSCENNRCVDARQ